MAIAKKIRVIQILFFLAISPAQHCIAGDRPSLSLSEFVFFANLSFTEVQAELYKDSPPRCVSDYFKKTEPFLGTEPYSKSKKEPGDQKEVVALRLWRLGQHMRCIFGEKAVPDAERFLSGIPLLLEWEGAVDGPMAEAVYAGKWIMDNPGSFISPFVHLFAAHRLRAVFEISFREKDEEKMEMARKSYRKHILSALKSNDRTIRCLAGDMEALSHVYMPCPVKP